jgi:hypothetical protein
VALRGETGEVAVVLVARAPGGQLILHHTAFAPWTSWPMGGLLTPVHATFEIATSSIQAGESAAPGRYAVAFGSPGGLVRFLDGVDPHVEGTGVLTGVAIQGSDAEFVAARGEGLAGATHLVGTFADGTLLATPVGTQLPPIPLGCAAVQPASGATVTWASGWIAAASTGAPIGACPTPMPTLPDHIDALALDPAAGVLGSTSIPTATVISVATAPHPDGAFVVWTDHAAGASALHAARLVASPLGVVAQVDLTPANDSGSSFAVGSTGRRLAVARRGAPGDIVLSMYDESLGLLASTTVAAGGFSGTISLLGAPDGRGVLVAWTAQDAHPWHGAIARLDCGP